MKIHIGTPRFTPITLTLESKHELEMFKALANYDPYWNENMNGQAKFLGVDEIDFSNFWTDLESLINRIPDQED